MLAYYHTQIYISLRRIEHYSISGIMARMLASEGAVVGVIVLLVPVQTVPITSKVASSNPVHGEVYSIQYYVRKCVSIFLNIWKNVGGGNYLVIFCDFYHLSSICRFKRCVHTCVFCVDAAMPMLCAALFLLISLTDSGTKSVNNKDRRQQLIDAKLIYYKYRMV